MSISPYVFYAMRGRKSTPIVYRNHIKEKKNS